MADPLPDFDVAAARADGVSDTDIATFLAPRLGFNLEQARKDGVADTAIVDFLSPAKAPAPAPKPESRGTWGSDLKSGFYGTSRAMAATSAVRADEEIDSLKKKIELFEKGDDPNVPERFRNARPRLDQVPGLKRQLAEAEKRKAGATTEVAKDSRALMDLPVNEPLQRFTEGNLGELLENPGAVARGLLGQSATAMVPFIVGVAVGGPAGGAIAGGTVGLATGGGQEAVRILQKHGVDATNVEAVTKALADPAIKAEIDKGFGTAQAIEGTVGAATGALGGVTVPAKTATGAVVKNVGLQAVGQGALSAGGEAAKQGIIEGEMHPGKIAAAGIGEALFAPVDAAAAAFHARSPKVVAEKVMAAPTVDAAIAEATAIVGQPVDVEAVAIGAQEFGGTADQQQAKMLKLFGGLNEGTVEVLPGGQYQYRIDDQAVPLNVWDERTPAVEGVKTISPELAATQRRVYGQMGIDVVYIADDGSVPFDGAVSPRNPDTIFLSNDPQRNAANVGAHEVTHVLETVTTPDGQRLGDLMHDMIVKNVTGAGIDQYVKVFGQDAPARLDFEEGPRGDSLHADAVWRHITQELGADIGGEAPKFPTFVAKVVDEVQTRYGADAAKGVMRKLMDGIQQAMRRLREMFSKGDAGAEYGVPDTVSQNWLTNLGEFHDLLAKGYAEKFGTQAERENVALRDMRDRVARQRFFEQPGPEIQPPTAPEGFTAPDRATTATPADTSLDSVLSIFPDMQVSEQGAIAAHNLRPEEQAALRKAGLIQEFVSEDGSKYEGVNPEKLWPLRQKRQAEIAAARKAAASPAEAPAPQGLPAPAAGYQEAAQRIATYRRWIGELDAQRRQEAPNSPQVRLLQQTEASILGKVNGVESRLTGAAAARLAQVREQLAGLLTPDGDTADMTRLRQAILDEQGKLARAAAVGSGPAPGTARAGAPQAAGRATEAAPSATRGRAVMPADVAQARADTDTAPTDGQKEAGNYSKGRLSISGIPFVMENPVGSIRRGVDGNGKAWESKLPADYGYVSRTIGADGDQVDAYVGPDHNSQRAWVIDQIDPKTGRLDEHKMMLGFSSPEAAIAAYDGAFSDGSGPRRRAAVTETTITDLKQWLADGDTKQPFGPVPVPSPEQTAKQEIAAPEKGPAIPSSEPVTAADRQAEAERIDDEEYKGKPAVRDRMAKDGKFFVQKGSDGIYSVTDGGLDNKFRIEPTAEERKAASRAEAEIDLADTPEERAAGKAALNEALRPAVERALAEKQTPPPPVATRAPVEPPAPLPDPEPLSFNPPAEWQPSPEQLTQARRVARGWTPETELRRPQSLVDFVRKNGGLRLDTPEAGDLRAADLGKLPGLLQRRGVQADWMAQRAQEAGYDLGPATEYGNGVNVDAFLDALTEDASGRRKHYPADRDTEAWQQQREAHIEFHNYLEDMGIKPKDMDPRQLAWVLQQEPETARLMALTERADSLGNEGSLELAYRLDAEIAQAQSEAAPEPGSDYVMADHRDLPAPDRQELDRLYAEYQTATGEDRAGQPTAQEATPAQGTAAGGDAAARRPEAARAPQEVPATRPERDAALAADPNTLPDAAAEGRQAALDGGPRTLPRGYLSAPMKPLQAAWFRAYDEAKAATPAADFQGTRAERDAMVNRIAREGGLTREEASGVFDQLRTAGEIRHTGTAWRLTATDGSINRDVLRQMAGKAPADGWTQIGRNRDGKMLYEDSRGVRSILDRGVRISEPVGIKPGSNEISINRTGRDEYLVAEPKAGGKVEYTPILPPEPTITRAPEPKPVAPDARKAAPDHQFADEVARMLQDVVGTNVKISGDDLTLFGGDRQGTLFSPKQVQTPEFRRWFGDSKVVDEDGKPRVVYHGTTADITEFDPGMLGAATGAPSAKQGFFFSSSPDVAGSYAVGHNAYEDVPFLRFVNKMTGGLYAKANEAIVNRFGASAIESGENIVPAYLSIKNPLVIEFNGQEYRERSFAYLLERARAGGHDGAVFRDAVDPGFKGGDSPSDIYVAFEPSQIKSAIGNDGSFDRSNNDIRYSPKPFYSALTRGVEGLKLDKATPGQWEATVRNMPGVKAEERAWVGLDDWLKQQPKSVTKAEVLDYLRANEIKVQEVEKRNIEAEPVRRNDIANRIYNTDYFQLASEQKRVVDDALADEGGGGAVKFAGYVLPGGENYRELLLTLPASKIMAPGKWTEARQNVYGDGKFYRVDRSGTWDRTPYETMAEAEGALSKPRKVKGPQFTDGHWDEPNVLAHIRFDDRTGPNGEKVLHIAEVQSDWHQKGRKQGYNRGDKSGWQEFEARGYTVAKDGEFWMIYDQNNDPVAEGATRQAAIDDIVARNPGSEGGVPDAPFKTTWPELAMKRMLRYAAENGYDRVSWDTGETNADRFDLSKSIDRIVLRPEQNGTMYHLEARGLDGSTVMDKRLRNADEVAQFIGKEPTERLFTGENKEKLDAGAPATLEGAGLKVGGEGMAAFYDKQLPLIAGKLGKKFGAKVEAARLLQDGGIWHAVAADGDNIGENIYSNKARWLVEKWIKDQERENDLAPGAYRLENEKDAPSHSIAITDAMREGVMQGQPLFSPKSPEFKRWFGASKIVDDDGQPLVAYKAMEGNIPHIQPESGTGMTHVSFDPDVAGHFGRPGGDGVREVYVKADNPFDYRKPADLAWISREMSKPANVRLFNKQTKEIMGDHYDFDHDARDIRAGLEDGAYQKYEVPIVRNLIKLRGHDGIYMTEDFQGDGRPNLGVFKPEQLKSATDNTGAFDPANPDIRYSPKIAGANPNRTYTPAEKKAFENVGRAMEPFSVRAWIDQQRENLGKRLIAKTLDPYIGIKENDPEGYMALRNANTTSGALEVFKEFGTIKFEGNAYALDRRNGGVDNSLIKPLQGEASDFIWWVAANRAERLKAEDRENLWSAEDIAVIKKTNEGELGFDYTLSNGSTTRSRAEAYTDSLRKLDTFNKNALDLAVESGLLKRDQVDALWSNPFYVPFYRQAEGERQFIGPNVKGGFVKQHAFKQLKGGSEKLRTHLWENAFGNWEHMIDAAMSNRAVAGVLETASGAGGPAREMTLQEVKYLSDKELKKRTVWVMRDGEKVYYEITDPMLFDAVSTLESLADPLRLLTAGRWFKKVLTVGVTLNPGFAARNLIRDTQQTMATAPSSLNIAANMATGFGMSDLRGSLKNVARAAAGLELAKLNLSDDAVSAIAGGATMRLATGTDTGIRDTNLSAILDTPESVKGFMNYLGTLANAYREVIGQGEDVNRFSLYRKLRSEGVPHDAASFAARDLADFTLSGAATPVRYIIGVVPFLNARLQGLYKVGRAATNADAGVNASAGLGTKSSVGRLATVLGASALAMMALDAIYADDEDYKKRTEFDRNTYFWFKFGDAQIRIPMGFEIAALGRMASNTAEAFYDKEMTVKRVMENGWALLGQQLQMNPIPQAVKPLFDIWENESGTGRRIEPMGSEKLRPEQRYTAANTLIARGASTGINAAMRAIPGLSHTEGPSPRQLDYLVGAYGGWLATQALGMADMVVRSVSNEPVRPARDFWAVATQGMISTEPRAESRYVDMLYKQGGEIERTYATYRDILLRGQAAEAQRFFDDNRETLQKHGVVSGLMRLESDLNRQIRMITNNPDPAVTAEQKKLQIMRITKLKSDAAERVFSVR